MQTIPLYILELLVRVTFRTRTNLSADEARSLSRVLQCLRVTDRVLPNLSARAPMSDDKEWVYTHTGCVSHVDVSNVINPPWSPPRHACRGTHPTLGQEGLKSET